LPAGDRYPETYVARTSSHFSYRMKRAAVQIGGAAIIVAIAGYVAQFLAARWLGPAHYTTFAVFGSILFIFVGTLSGAGQELIRVSRVEKLRRDSQLTTDRDHTHPRIGPLAIAIGAGTAVVVFLTGLVWGPLAFGHDWLSSLILLSLAGLFVSGTIALGTTFAGLARWFIYSLVVSLEGLSRLVFFVLAAFLLPTVLGFSVAAILAFAPGLLVGMLWPTLRRETLSIRSDSPLGLSTTRILRSMGASILSSVLVVGWPALLSAAAAANPRGSTAASLGVLILLVTLTRAPLMVPLTSFQNALVARFTGMGLDERRRSVALGIGIIVVGSCVLAGLAALLGPLLLPLIFGHSYQAGPGLIAALTGAAAGLGIITLTGVVAITSGGHSRYLLGWLVAIIVALLVVFLAPVPFEWATVLALFAGPLAGAVVQVGALRRPRDLPRRVTLSE
jgi:O-antigen/teichoic acid export membrane protein